MQTSIDNILLWVLISHFVIYISYIMFKYGLIPSISNSYYQLRKDHSVWMFVSFMILQGAGIVLLTMPSSNTYSITGLLTGLGLWIVATSPAYKNVNNDPTPITFSHYIGAGLSFISAHLNMWLYDQKLLCYISAAILIILMITMFKRKYLMLLAELDVFIIMYIALILR